MSKKMVRSRALSRSLSLQRGGGPAETHNGLTDDRRMTRNYDDSKGTVRSLPKDERTPVDHLLIAAAAVNDDPESALTNVAIDGEQYAWMQIDDLELRPTCCRTLFALLKLRCCILLRDLQRLYLMIVLPLGFTAIGLYLNSIQVILPVMRPLALNGTSYEGSVGRMAIFDGSNGGVSMGQLIAQLNGSVEVTLIDDGNYSQFLAIAPHMAALILHTDEPTLRVTAMYNDTMQHSLPIILNLLSNAIYRIAMSSSDNSGDDVDVSPIEVRAHPFRQTAQPQEFNVGTFSTALFVGMIFVLIPVSLAVDMVYDREMKTKNQLRVNGLTSALYFLAYFIVLSALMVIICSALLGMVFMFDIPAFRQVCSILCCNFSQNNSFCFCFVFSNQLY